MPALISAIGTGLLTKFLQKQKQVRRSVLSEGSSASKRKDQEEKLDNLTVCLIALAICFLLFLIPFTVSASLRVGDVEECAALRTYTITVSFTMLNSSVNFFISYWLLPSFRNAVKLTCGCLKNRQEETPETRATSGEVLSNSGGQV